MLTLVILFVAGCSTPEKAAGPTTTDAQTPESAAASQTAPTAPEKTFYIAYQSKISGEIEPCG